MYYQKAHSRRESGITPLLILAVLAVASLGVLGGSFEVSRLLDEGIINVNSKNFLSALQSSSNYLDAAKFSKFSAANNVVGTVTLPDGSFSAYKIVSAKVDSEGSRFIGEEKIRFLSGDDGLGKFEGGVIAPFYLADGSKTVGLVMDRMIAEFSYQNTSYTIKILQGEVRDGRLSGDFIGQTYQAGYIVAGTIDEDGKIKNASVVQGISGSTEAQISIAQNALSLFEKVSEVINPKVLAASTGIAANYQVVGSNKPIFDSKTGRWIFPTASSTGNISTSPSQTVVNYLQSLSQTGNTNVSQLSNITGQSSVNTIYQFLPAYLQPAATVAGVSEIKSGSSYLSVSTSGGISTLSLDLSSITAGVSDSSITSAKISDGTITNSDISGSAGIDQGKLGTIDAANKVAGSAVQLATGGGLINNSGLSLSTSCSNNQILKWNSTTAAWVCATQSGGVGVSLDVAKDGTIITSGASEINFAGSNFNVTDSPTGQANVTISGLTASNFSSANISQWTNNSGYITGISWGNITGTLANQTDLNTALSAKANTSSLGTIASQNSNSVSITGGSLSGLTSVGSTAFTGSLTGDVTGNVSGNAGTVTNGLYSTGSYANPSWITSLSATKVLPDQTGQNGKVLGTNGSVLSWVTNSSGVAWGAITGTLSDQSDLNTALGLKYDSTNFIEGTNYLTPSGSAANLTGFPTLNQNTTGTASNITGVLGATSFPAMTGDVTNTQGSLSNAISSGAVTLSKMANLAANSIIGNNTGSPITPVALSVSQVKTLLNIGTSDISGLGTIATQTSNNVSITGGSISGLTSISATNLSGTNTGDNATNSNYTSDYRAANFVAGTNYLTPTGSAAGLTSFPTLNQNTTGTASNITGVLGATSFPALSGDLGNTQGSLTITIGAKAVTLAKMADMATASFLGRNTAGSGVPEVLSASTAKSILSIGTGDVSGLGTIATQNSNNVSITGGSLSGLTSIAATTITGALTGDVTGNVSGNAGSVSNGLYSTGSYADPGWITSLAATKVLPDQSGQNGKVLGTNGSSVSWVTNSSGVAWGAITGTLSDQSDLNTALGLKYDSTNFVAGTNYLTPTGSAASLTGFPTLNQNTTGTASNITGVLGATSFPAMTGDVTNTQGSLSTAISSGAVTLSKMANMATASFLGRNTAGSGAPEVLSASTAKSILSIATGDVSGLGTIATQASNNVSITGGTLSGLSGLTVSSGSVSLPSGSVANAALANGAVANLSGTNSGDNAANSNYSSDYRASNFVAGTNYLAPNGSGASLTGITGDQVLPTQTGQGGKVLGTNGATVSWVTNSSGVAWGAITGTLSDQSDLNTALSGKLGTSLTSANIFIGNGSGVATGVSMSGDVTIDNTGATTIGNTKVTLSKMANMATASLLGRNTAGSGAPEVLSASTAKSILSIATGDVSGLGTIASQASSNVAITGGTIAGLTGFGVRSTGTGAFDLTINNTENLTAGRTLTLITGNAARTLNLTGGNLTVSDAAKTLAGTGTSLTIANAISFGSGTTGAITLGTGTNTLAIATTNNTSITLPTTGTLLNNSLTSANIYVGNGSNVATGVTMSGDVTIDNTGATTIGATKVTFAKMQNVSATNRILGRATAGSGVIEEITVGGDLSQSGSTFTIGSGAVTLAKMANMATASFLGRNTAGSGAPEVLSATTAKSILSIATGDVSGLGTIATQNSNSVTLTGGTINGIAIGGSTAAAGTFTTLTANTSITDVGLTSAGVVTNTAAGLLGTIAGTTTTVLHGNASGAPTFGAITGSDLASNIAISTSGNIQTTGTGTITSAGAITGPTATNTINGIIINSGAVSNVSTLGTGTATVTSSNASALAVGLNGATNPVLKVDASTASVATGLQIKGAATGGTTALTVIDSGANASLTIDAKGTGTITIGGTSTGATTINHGLTLTSGTTLTLTGDTISGSPTWSNNQAITLSTASQPNVTSLGTLTGLTVTGTTALNLGSDATGDMFYRGAGGSLVRLADVATGSCLVSGGVGAAPTWGACAAGGGISTIKEGGTNIVTSAAALNFAANDFVITDETGGQGGIAIDYTNSHITRDNQTQTISGAWTFTNNLTLNAQNDLRLADSDSSNYVAFQAPASIGTNVTWTLPSADGSGCFQSDGGGNMSIAACGGGGQSQEVKTFTSSSPASYQIPTGSIMIIAEMWGGGGGGGGGAGANGANNNKAGGGGGGGGGSYNTATFLATGTEIGAPGATIYGVAGAAGTGGGGGSQATGVNGVAGGQSCVTTSASGCSAGTVYISAYGGGFGGRGVVGTAGTGGGGGGGGGVAGIGNNASAGTGGTGGNPNGGAVNSNSASIYGGGGGATAAAAASNGGSSLAYGGGGGSAGTTVGGNNSGSGGSTLKGGAGGGAGGSINNSVGTITARNGGTGGTRPTLAVGGGGAGGTAGANTQANGTAGANGFGFDYGGSGGGGGASRNGTGTAGFGAAGGLPGGGGGGGGGATAASAVGGNGGNGGRGEVRLYVIKGTASDLAEIYSTNDSTIKSGDVVSLDPSLIAGVKKSGKAYDPNVMGIISTQPSVVMGTNEDPGTSSVLVALSGRVPVKVSLEGGEIKPGDYLTSSSIPGVAMKATRYGPMLGQAMSGFNGDGEREIINGQKVGLVTAFIKNGYGGSTDIADQAISSKDILLSLVNQESLNADIGNELSIGRITAGLDVITPSLYANNLIATNSLLFENNAGEKMVSIDASGSAYFAGILTAKLIKADLIEGSINDPKLQSIMSVLGISTEEGKGLSVDTNVVLNKGLSVNLGAKFLSDAMFSGQVTFDRPPLFDKNTGGFASIKEGSREVDIEFENEYALAPVVTASPIWDADKATLDVITQLGAYMLPKQDYIITDISAKGFKIVLEEPAVTDLKFSWMALAIKDAQTSELLGLSASESARIDNGTEESYIESSNSAALTQ